MSHGLVKIRLLEGYVLENLRPSHLAAKMVQGQLHSLPLLLFSVLRIGGIFYCGKPQRRWRCAFTEVSKTVLCMVPAQRNSPRNLQIIPLVKLIFIVNFLELEPLASFQFLPCQVAYNLISLHVNSASFTQVFLLFDFTGVFISLLTIIPTFVYPQAISAPDFCLGFPVPFIFTPSFLFEDQTSLTRHAFPEPLQVWFHSCVQLYSMSVQCFREMRTQKYTLDFSWEL